MNQKKVKKLRKLARQVFDVNKPTSYDVKYKTVYIKNPETGLIQEAKVISSIRLGQNSFKRLMKAVKRSAKGLPATRGGLLDES